MLASPLRVLLGSHPEIHILNGFFISCLEVLYNTIVHLEFLSSSGKIKQILFSQFGIIQIWFSDIF